MLTASGVGAIHYGQIYTRYGTWAEETLSCVSSDDANKLTKADPGDIIITNTSENLEDVGKAVAWLGDSQIVTGGHATVIKHDFEPKFLSYWFQTPDFFDQKKKLATGTKVIDVSAKQLEKVEVPVPPRKIQHEIVRILDSFSKLEAELEAELEARKQQYEHYLSALFDYSPAEVTFKTFTEVGSFSRGNGPQKKDFIDSGVGCIHYGQIYTHYGVSTLETNKFVNSAIASKSRKANSGDVIIAVTSENDDDLARSVAWLGAEPVVVSNHTLIFTSDMNPRFVSYFLRTRHFDAAKRKYISGTKVRSLPLRAFENIQIPVPSIEEQARLADALDKFDALVNDLSIGLPAELKARRKQYEYYRDQLLKFEELAS